jgi:hypothetical protein
MTIQFLGDEESSGTRVYAFRVVNTLQQERRFKLSVKTVLLEENRFKIQDLPDLCFTRLKRELSSETAERSAPLQMSVSDGELKKYIEEHYPPKRKPNGPHLRQR